MRKVVIGLAAAWAVAQSAAAAPVDDLQIVANYAMPWNIATVGSSLDFAISIQNLLPGAAAPTPDLLQYWQIRFEIIPDGASHGVYFDSSNSLSPASPTTLNGVGDSIFEGSDRTSDARGVVTTGLITGFFDPPGATVPASTTTELLRLRLTATPNAAGSFLILAIPDSCADAFPDSDLPVDPPYTGAAWSYYSADGTPVTMPFHDIPFGTLSQPVPVVIGSVTIAPEPSSSILLVSAVAAVAMGWIRQRWRKRD
jgi:hypothetical protein